MPRDTTQPSQAQPPDPYDAFFAWCDANGFIDVGIGPVKEMKPGRFDDAMAAYVASVRKEPQVSDD